MANADGMAGRAAARLIPNVELLPYPKVNSPPVPLKVHSESNPALGNRRAGEEDIVQYFSQQELTRAPGKSIANCAKLHNPCDELSKQALEISLVAMEGRKFHPVKCVAFCLVNTLWGISIAFAVHWYFYAAPFGGDDGLLNSSQSNWAITGFFFVFYGASCLLMVWLPGLFSLFTCEPCPLRDAPLLLLHCDDGTKDFVRVQTCNGPDGVTATRVVTFRKLRFVFNPDSGDFEAETFTDPVVDSTQLGLGHTQGLTTDMHASRKQWYGINLIDVPIPSIPALLAHEVRLRHVVSGIRSIPRTHGRTAAAGRRPPRGYPYEQYQT
jgi:hypothetical protein